MHHQINPCLKGNISLACSLFTECSIINNMHYKLLLYSKQVGVVSIIAGRRTVL